MNKSKQFIINDLNKQLKQAIDDAAWYHKRFSDAEIRIIALKEALGDLKDEQ